MNEEGSNVRTTISLSKVVHDWAEELMKSEGFNGNFSAFVAHLIRAEKRRKDDQQTAALRAKIPNSK